MEGEENFNHENYTTKESEERSEFRKRMRIRGMHARKNILNTTTRILGGSGKKERLEEKDDR